jgi:Methylene-tetrahydrofolate reductase C terminal
VIIQKQKDYEDILASIEGENKIFLGGCSDCATACKTGGEEELVALKARLEADGKTVTGSCIFDTACTRGAVRQMGKEHKDEIGAADSIILMACGTGVQTISEALDKIVHVGVDSLFVGQVQRLGKYAEKCSTCGKCVLEDYEGICPVTRCAKGLLNGPCGGYNEGMCEVDPDQKCAWIEIYERMKERGKLDKMRTYQEAKSQGERNTPRSYTWPKPERAKKA